MKRVRVYYNLHKKCLSVLCKQENGWRLWLYANEISLLNVNFKVSEAGRQRVLREKKKNVHAFVEGKETFFDCDIKEMTRLYYNPFKSKNFFDRFHQPVLMAKQCMIIGNKHGYEIYAKIS